VRQLVLRNALGGFAEDPVCALPQRRRADGGLISQLWLRGQADGARWFDVARGRWRTEPFD
jgi:hypothetical protein